MAKDDEKPQKPRMAKVAMSLPRGLVDDLDYLVTRLGVSRSALASELLSDSVAEMRRILSVIPPNPTPADLLRMRGESEAFVRQRIANATRLTDDLFSGMGDSEGAGK